MNTQEIMENAMLSIMEILKSFDDTSHTISGAIMSGEEYFYLTLKPINGTEEKGMTLQRLKSILTQNYKNCRIYWITPRNEGFILSFAVGE